MAGRRGVRLTRKAGTTAQMGALTLNPSGVTIEGNKKRISGTTSKMVAIVTNPSGVTIEGATAAVTATLMYPTTILGASSVTSTSFGGKVNFGQGTAYKIYQGSHGLIPGSVITGGTTLSAGTIQLTTGLTDVLAFYPSTYISHTTGPVATTTFVLTWRKGYLGSNGGVTVFLGYAGTTISDSLNPHALTAVTPNWSILRGGVSVNWIAIGI